MRTLLSYRPLPVRRSRRVLALSGLVLFGLSCSENLPNGWSVVTRKPSFPV